MPITYCRNINCDLNVICKRYTDMDQETSKVFNPATIKYANTGETDLYCYKFLDS